MLGENLPELKLYVRSVSAEFARNETGEHVVEESVAGNEGPRPGWGREGGSGLIYFAFGNTSIQGSLSNKQRKTLNVLGRLRSRKEGDGIYLFFDPDTGAVFSGNQVANQIVEGARNGQIEPKDLDKMTEILRKFYNY